MFRFLRNPTELKSIKNISLLRQTMANQAQQQQQQQQLNIKSEQPQAPPASPSYLNGGSIVSIISNSNFPHLSLTQQMHQVQRQSSPVPPSPHHLQQQSPIIKLEANIEHETDDMKPTDLSTNGSSGNNDRKYLNNNGIADTDCYP